MEIHNCVAVSCCGYCSVSIFLCIHGKMGVKCIILSNVIEFLFFKVNNDVRE